VTKENELKNVLNHLFGVFYSPDEEDRQLFGQYLVEHQTFEHGVYQLVARVPKAFPSGDGYNVEIWEARLPARFYEIRVQSTANSVGEVRSGGVLSTGSGQNCGALALTISTAFAEGFLGFHDPNEV